MIRLRTLGSLQIQDGDGADKEQLLAQSRRVALLVYLALATPRGFHRRDRLVALFWPEHDESHARNSLSQSIHVLRRALGGGVIVSRADEELSLDWERVWCDAVAFDAALDAGHLAEALELYRGPLLDGFHVTNAAPELDHWLEQQREHYAQRYAVALDRMASELERAGDAAGAVVWRQRAAARDPLSSRAALALMRAFVGAGEPARAVQHARVHETLLRQELGTSPDPAVASFANALAARRELAEGAHQPERVDQQGAGVSAAPPPDGDSSPTHRGRRRSVARIALVGGALAVAVAGGLALVRTRASGGAPEIGCVAVLPLSDLSRDATQQYLADGITDAIITDLARYERPLVISHTSTSRYRGSQEPIRQIAHDLNCEAVVEGTVVRDEDRVRVAARLIDAATERPLWSDSYEGDLRDLLLVERRVAEAIARQVRAVIVKADGSTGTVPRRVDPLTYAIYLRGRTAFASRNPAALRQAQALFTQAVARDSQFALAYSGLSDTYRMLGGLGYAPLSFWTDSARRFANRALALDDAASEAHTSLAALLTDDANWPAAEAEYRRALALQPGNAQAHAWYAALLVTLDRKDEALREIRRASELDPLTQPIAGMKTQIETYAGVRNTRRRPDERAGLVDPTHPGTIAMRSMNLARAKRCPEAYAENRNAQGLAPNVTMIQLSLVNVHLLCGQPAKARALLDSVERHPDARLMSTYIAEVYVTQGQRDSAFGWLANGQWGMLGRMNLRMSRQLAPLRSDPRFAVVLRSARMP